MPVLTRKEYEEASIVEPPKDTKEEVEVDPLASASSSFLWTLGHPERAKDEFVSFEDIVTIGGQAFKRTCENNRVQTDQEPLAQFLLGKGWLLIERKKL